MSMLCYMKIENLCQKSQGVLLDKRCKNVEKGGDPKLFRSGENAYFVGCLER